MNKPPTKEPEQEASPEEQRELQELEQSLQEQADQWRERLKDPLIKQQIKTGKMQISPLVSDLLLAFPSKQKKPSNG